MSEIYTESDSNLAYFINELKAVAKTNNTTIQECLEVAYEEIKNRKGKKWVPQKRLLALTVRL